MLVHADFKCFPILSQIDKHIIIAYFSLYIYFSSLLITSKTSMLYVDFWTFTNVTYETYPREVTQLYKQITSCIIYTHDFQFFKHKLALHAFLLYSLCCKTYFDPLDISRFFNTQWNLATLNLTNIKCYLSIIHPREITQT
jgi:hypothetical protein